MKRMAFVMAVVDPPGLCSDGTMSDLVQAGEEVNGTLAEARETAVLNLLLFCRGRKLTDVRFDEATWHHE